MGLKIGGCAPLGEGELGPHLTQCPWAEAYLRTKWHLSVWPQQTWAENMGESWVLI